MGLQFKTALHTRKAPEEAKESDKVIALAGNPNVGKSTVFNGLTGMNQHTGNWPGKTVASAQGTCQSAAHRYTLVDVPGTYSLMAHSAEEEVARNFICFGQPDLVVVVCDATCLERNLNLVLQTIETGASTLVCVNLMDEAKRKHIRLDLPALQSRLGVPVLGITARDPKQLNLLLNAMDTALAAPSTELSPIRIAYPKPIEDAVERIVPLLEGKRNGGVSARFIALRLLDDDPSLLGELSISLGEDLTEDAAIAQALCSAKEALAAQGFTAQPLRDAIVSALVKTAETLCKDIVHFEEKSYDAKDRRLDRILTGRRTGYPIMLALLALVFWITITGANYPSAVLADALFWLQDRLTDLFTLLNAPAWLHGALVEGVYRVLAWVVSVMLPPMAIFFPLFTLLEDAGYLPRVAYNLDRPFKRCSACGKQALTMCMGFGCNAVGVTGCRIIDSPRERLLAILTNNFVPCNGRFPTLIALLTMFFLGAQGGLLGSLWSALGLTALIVLGVAATFLSTKLLSKTVLKGVPSSFALELPPFRKPQIGKVVVRSIFDRTLFVLGRAVAVAAPAGLVIWLLANITVGDMTLLAHSAAFLDPFARALGMDGVILMAFILGFPANEIVIPIIIMAYMAQGSILELDSLTQLKELFLANGWTWVTAACTMLFSLMHWPCSTTLWTIKKETGSWKWTALAAALPTAAGMAGCFVLASVARLFG